MAARLLSRLWKLQAQHTHLSQRLAFHGYKLTQSYATGRIGTQASTEPTRLAIQIPVRNYSETVETAAKNPTGSIELLLERLDNQFKHNGYVNYEQFKRLMDQLEGQTTHHPLITKDVSLFLLSACGDLLPAQSTEERLGIFERLWQYLQRHEQLTAEHWQTKLQVLQKNPQPNGLPRFDELLAEVTKYGDGADLLTELLDAVCCGGNMRDATRVMAAMRERNIALTERHFNALILGHGRNHDLAGCRAVLESMAAAGILASSATQIALILAYLENEQTAKAEELLLKYQSQFSAQQILRVLREILYTRSIDEQLIVKVVRELPHEFLVDTEVPVPLRNICIELIYQGQLPAVVCIVGALPKPEFNENQDVDKFGVFLLQELLRLGRPSHEVIAVAQLLKDTEKNSRALHIAAEIALRRHTPDCLDYLNALAATEPLRAHYFWPIMLHERRQSGEAGVLQTLRLMADYNVECTAETLNSYVLPNLKVSLEDPVQLVKSMDAAGVRPSHILAPLMLKLLSMQKPEEVLKLAELYPSKVELGRFVQPLCSMGVTARATKRLAPYARLVAALARRNANAKEDFVGYLLVELLAGDQRLAKDLNALKRLLNDLQKHEVSVSPSAVDLIRGSLQPREGNSKDDADMKAITMTLKRMTKSSLELPSTATTGQASSFIKHPRDMSLDELECHLLELESKRMNTRGVLRRLLQLCVRDNRLERALEVKRKCDELRVQTSPGMMASTLDLYIKLKDLPMAVKSLQRLKQEYPAFAIDEHKIIDFAALFVREGQLEAGKQLLKERSEASKVIGGDYVLKNVWNFLNQVATLAAQQQPPLPGDTNWSRDTFQFLRELRYCRPHNTVLGPIVREYLLRGDLPAAVGEFVALGERHKHTPLQFELLSLLVRLGNGEAKERQRYPVSQEQAQELLGQVTAAVAKIHGVVNMNSALLLAFAESGTEQQLRRLLINPEFRINQEQLLRNCEHLGQVQAVETLVRLARGVRGLHHVVDEQGIYKMLLDRFVGENNWEGAVQLYEHLEADDDLKISQDFLRTLVNLLRVNQVAIPSNVALRAQVI